MNNKIKERIDAVRPEIIAGELYTYVSMLAIKFLWQEKNQTEPETFTFRGQPINVFQLVSVMENFREASRDFSALSEARDGQRIIEMLNELISDDIKRLGNYYEEYFVEAETLVKSINDYAPTYDSPDCLLYRLAKYYLIMHIGVGFGKQAIIAEIQVIGRAFPELAKKLADEIGYEFTAGTRTFDDQKSIAMAVLGDLGERMESNVQKTVDVLERFAILYHPNKLALLPMALKSLFSKINSPEEFIDFLVALFEGAKFAFEIASTNPTFVENVLKRTTERMGTKELDLYFAHALDKYLNLDTMLETDENGEIVSFLGKLIFAYLKYLKIGQSLEEDSQEGLERAKIAKKIISRESKELKKMFLLPQFTNLLRERNGEKGLLPMSHYINNEPASGDSGNSTPPEVETVGYRFNGEETRIEVGTIATFVAQHIANAVYGNTSKYKAILKDLGLLLSNIFNQEIDTDVAKQLVDGTNGRCSLITFRPDRVEFYYSISTEESYARVVVRPRANEVTVEKFTSEA